MKPPSALNPCWRPSVLPPDSKDAHPESERGGVIGKRLKDASAAEATAGSFAHPSFNDVTARDIQKREVQHTRAKSYDTFACAGPWIEDSLSPADLRVTCKVNGELRQDGRTSDMVFSPAR